MFFVGKDLVYRDLGEWMMVEGLLIQLSLLMMRFYMGEETITTKETDTVNGWTGLPGGNLEKILVAEKKNLNRNSSAEMETRDRNCKKLSSIHDANPMMLAEV